jgi:Flp pilus assembly protein TadG
MRSAGGFTRSDGGQAVVLIALAMTGLLLGVGLAIDTGRLFVARRDAQAAADAAAWAGAVQLRAGGAASAAMAAATTDATENRYTSGSGGVTVSVSSPPGSGAFVGNDRYVEVTITVQVGTTLMPSTVSNVTVRAVAGAAPVDQGFAVVTLDATAAPALNVSNQGEINVTNAGIKINSSSANAGDNRGVVTISPTPSHGTSVVGNAAGPNPWPNETTGQQSLPDPFLNFPKPDTTALTPRTPVCCTLQPGVYTTNIGGNNAWVMEPGIYVFKNAGIDLEGNSSITSASTPVSSATGTGVFIFVTTSAYPASGGTCPTPTLKLRGNNGTNITSPTTGTYQGMLIYQDPACNGEISIGGGAAFTGNGTIYAPAAEVEANGSNAGINVPQIVAKTVDVQNGKLNMNYSGGAVAQPRIPALSE